MDTGVRMDTKEAEIRLNNELAYSWATLLSMQ
jgi:hypothetical protein